MNSRFEVTDFLLMHLACVKEALDFDGGVFD
jgi:hypothetical protein